MCTPVKFYATSRSLTRGRESTLETVINEVKSNELESRIGAWTDIPYRCRHAPKRPVRQTPQNRIVATRRGYNEDIGPESIGPLQLSVLFTQPVYKTAFGILYSSMGTILCKRYIIVCESSKKSHQICVGTKDLSY